jgi:excisionase family DNA binding protein
MHSGNGRIRQRPRNYVGNTIAHLGDTAMTDTPNLLTVGQAAQPLGGGVLTIRSWVRGDRCPVVCATGRRVRVPTAWVDELLAKGWR